MTENPYKPPVVNAAGTISDSGFRVEGKQLVVRSGAVLPQVCVKTNEPVTQDQFQQRTLSWCPPILGLLILLSGLVLIIVYFIVREKCQITFGLSPVVRRRYRNVRIFKIVSAVVLFFAIPFALAIDSSAIILAVCVLFLIAFASLFVGNSPIAITKFRKGEFWITGCSKDFLAGFTK